LKVHIISPDLHGRIDGTINANLLRFFNVATSQDEADVVIIPVSYYGDYIFNHSLHEIRKPWVIFDYLEYGSSWKDGTDSHILGQNSANFACVSGPEWMKLDAFVRDHKPIVYFKRELLERERSNWLHPIEFPCYLPAWPVQSKEDFDKRAIEVFFSWGLSHESRPRFHGEIFTNALHNGISIISAWDQFENFDYANHKRVWATIHSPHTTRRDISTVMHYQSMAKISVSLPGNGFRCFRDNESACNSIPAYWDDCIARAYDWIDGVNCIRLSPYYEFIKLSGDGIYKSDLHQIYLNGLDTVEKYRSQNFVNNYIAPIVKGKL